MEQMAQAAKQCSAAVVATFVTAAAYRGGIGLAGVYPKLMATLLGGATPVALLALGNPYLLSSYQDVAAYMTTFSTSLSSERSAVKALFGEIPISGKMPISIPGLAAIGDGIEVPKTR